MTYLRALTTAAAVVTALLVSPSSASVGCTSTVTWKQVGVDSWQLPDAGLRSQGVATDGTSWFFSWQYGLEHANDAYVDLLPRVVAIPGPLLLAGSDHIGDIDYYKGKLVVPIEDGHDNYQHPYLAFANPKTLAIGSYSAVPWQLQTEGVPWVAVDSKRALAYTAEWNKTTQLNVFDLNNHFAYLRSIPLQYKLSRIQGAKVYGDTLIATVDDKRKSVYQISLGTGAISKLFSLNDGDELEGIAIRQMADGSLVHVILLHGRVQDPSSGFHATFQHYARMLTRRCS